MNLPLDIWREISLDSINVWCIIASVAKGHAVPVNALIDKHCKRYIRQTKVITTVDSLLLAHSVEDLPAIVDIRGPRLWCSYDMLARQDKYVSVDDMGMTWRINNLLGRQKNYPCIIYHNGGMEWTSSQPLIRHITEFGLIVR